MSAPRPTLRSLAAEAGVSPMTVSLALRGSPEVSTATRQRLQRLAAERGYRPDPAVAKLMHHLRTRRPAKFRACLAGLGERWPEEMRSAQFLTRLRNGLRARAEALGYTFEVFALEDYPKPAQLRRVLQSRGIEGVVLLPLLHPRAIDRVLDWGAFAAVTATSSVLSPAFHSVLPRHFDNLLEACARLRAAGYRRIGLAISQDWDVRVNHRWSGAIAWNNAHGGGEPVAPFLGAGDLRVNPAELRAWLERERPDVVISDSFVPGLWDEVVRPLPARLRPRRVTTNWPQPDAEAGIDQQVERIGAAAIDVLSGLLNRGEKGLPEQPTTTVVHGAWVAGTLPRRRAAAPVKGS